MTVTIAVAGKGGTGKTTLSGLLTRYLVQHKGGKILTIDADPSSNLHLVLGLPLAQTVGDIREDAREAMQPGMSRQDWLSYTVRMAVEEGDDFDLLAMGRPEGQGCYCAANHMLRSIIDGINAGYDFVVMDNEAGMEHLSRRTTRDVDHLLLVSDASQRGMAAAEAMLSLSKELEINVRTPIWSSTGSSGNCRRRCERRQSKWGRPSWRRCPTTRCWLTSTRRAGRWWNCRKTPPSAAP